MSHLPERPGDGDVNAQLLLELSAQAGLERFAPATLASRKLPQAAEEPAGRAARDEDAAASPEHPRRRHAAGHRLSSRTDGSFPFDAGAPGGAPLREGAGRTARLTRQA